MGLTTLGIDKQEIVDIIYPIGSIYMSVSGINPESIFGGKWEKIRGRFLLAENDKYVAGSSGGEESHLLNSSELPYTEGTFMMNQWVTLRDGSCNSIASTSGICSGIFVGGNIQTMAGNVPWNNAQNGVRIAFGGSQAHNNMPPYLSVYVWKRIE